MNIQKGKRKIIKKIKKILPTAELQEVDTLEYHLFKVNEPIITEELREIMNEFQHVIIHNSHREKALFITVRKDKNLVSHYHQQGKIHK